MTKNVTPSLGQASCLQPAQVRVCCFHGCVIPYVLYSPVPLSYVRLSGLRRELDGKPMCNNPEVLTYDWIKTGGQVT
jgi:hypothetical protein